MHTAHARGDTIACAADQQFIDLICSDEDLLDAEFDAIIAAEWPTPPADTPGRSAAGGHQTGRAARRATARNARPVARPLLPGIDGSARQRSPPGPELVVTAQDSKGR